MTEEQPKPPRPVRSWAMNTIALLGIFYTLFLARELLLPLVLAALLALLLTPPVLWLQRIGVPRAAAALFVVISLSVGLVVCTALLAQPAAAWAQKAPEMISELQRKLYPLTEKMEEVSEAAKKVRKMAKPGDDADTDRVVQVSGFTIQDVLRQTQAFLLAVVVVLFLLYFLLASGHRLWRHTLSVLPTRHSRRRLIVVASRVQREISHYLLTITVINVVLGVLVAIMTAAFGVPNPMLWGALTGLLNFVPYVGPALTGVMLAVVSMASLPSLEIALLVPALFFVLAGLEGQLVTPSILGRRLNLNPAFIFVSLIFWGWLWGIVGALLAVPIMVSLKIIFDRIRFLQPLGTILAR